MTPAASAFSPVQRAVVWGLAVVLVASGLAWIAVDASIDAGNPDLRRLAWRHLALVAHGVSAGAALIMLGALMCAHARRAWRAGRNRASGAALSAALAGLCATGWMLYYGTESLRAAAQTVHLYVGLLIPILLSLHRLLGRRKL